jgi:hypothetical protein
MTARVERIGGTVHLAHDDAAGLESMRGLTEPEEFACWLADYEDGRLLVVTIELFAEVVGADTGQRVTDHDVIGLSFYRGRGDDNIDHAIDVVRFGVDHLCASLQEAGITTTTERLLRLPVTIEVDPDLERRVAA